VELLATGLSGLPEAHMVSKSYQTKTHGARRGKLSRVLSTKNTTFLSENI